MKGMCRRDAKAVQHFHLAAGRAALAFGGFV